MNGRSNDGYHLGMADDLLERSTAAIAEARRLAAENLRLRRLVIQMMADYGWRVGAVSQLAAQSGPRRTR
jgi:hypothetical protein